METQTSMKVEGYEVSDAGLAKDANGYVKLYDWNWKKV